MQGSCKVNQIGTARGTRITAVALERYGGSVIGFPSPPAPPVRDHSATALRCLIRIASIADFLLQPPIPFVGFWHVLPFPTRFTETRWAHSALASLRQI
jgi:hypothetical protein